MARFKGGTAVEVVNQGAAEAIPVDLVAGTVEVEIGANVGLLNAAEAEINPATEEKQDDGITLLGTIDADTSKIPALGTAIMTGASPVTLATDDTLTAAANVLLGTIDADTGGMYKALGGVVGPTIDSYTTAIINASAATANQEIVATPGANKQIWVMMWQGSANTGDGSISWQDEDDTAISGVMEVLRRVQVGAQSSNFAAPVMKVATDKALELDTVTCGFTGNIGYAIVSV